MSDLPVYFYKARAHDGNYWAFLCADEKIGVLRYDRVLKSCARDVVGISQKHDRRIRRIFGIPPVELSDRITGSVHHREEWVPLPLSRRDIKRYNREIDEALSGV